MKFFELLLVTLLCFVNFPSIIISEDVCTEGQALSLYNIGTGDLPHPQDSDYKIIETLPAHKLLSDTAKASWRLVDNSDGSVSFRNLKWPSWCLRHETHWYSKQYYLVMDACNIENDSRFKFLIRLHKSGAIQIVLKDHNKCLYDDGEGYLYYGVYADECQDDHIHLWAFVPPLKIDI